MTPHGEKARRSELDTSDPKEYHMSGDGQPRSSCHDSTKGFFGDAA
jgi:hypothetical protein